MAGLGAYGSAWAVSETLDVTAVVEPAVAPTQPGGNTGSGSAQYATVVLSGFTFPSGKLTLLKDGAIATTLIANSDGTFRIVINNLQYGNYQLSVYAEDELGNSSVPHTVTLAAYSSQPYEFANIILPPTIRSSALLAQTGSMFYISGYAPAGSTVSLEVPGRSQLANAMADTRGFYRIDVTAGFDPGIYQLRAKAAFNGASSALSKPVQMLFYAEQEEFPGSPPSPPAQLASCVDFNRDRRVNLIDFSILIYWYDKTSVPDTVDCNGDRVIDIKDFSILMYFWTG